MDTKNNIFKNLNKFYSAEVQESPNMILPTLKQLIEFDNGYIYMSDKIAYKTVTDGNSPKHTLKENMLIKGSQFGHIEIAKNIPFEKEEKELFKTCALIISGIIKNYELSKIINKQLNTLQEGIAEKDNAYKSEKVKNDFFSNFSHELRTPLNSIISSSEILSEEIFGELTNKQKEYVTDIRVAGILLLGMINDILDFSKIECNLMKLNKTEFDLLRLFEEIYNIVLPIANKKNIKIKISCPNNLTIKADYQKFQQIMFNLTSNAIKYTPDNGNILISAQKENDKAIICVNDNGIGIAKKDQGKIFNKFTQLGAKKDSSGLGLTITRELINLHNGSIEVESKLGKGSKFKISCPLG